MSRETSELTPEEVFPSVGKPKHTYVERDAGKNERRLASGLRDKGQICILTGPSKTGKTSLYQRVLPEIKKVPLILRCSGDLKADEFWASALEKLDFSRIAESSSKWGLGVAAKIGARGEAGWSWLAKVMVSVGLSVSATGEYGVRREFAQSKLSAHHLIPLLQQMPVQLVVEDFHYLAEDVKREIFQQWKAFTDEGVSVLVVSTTHHTVDIARANPDLTGRMRLVDVGKWSRRDLMQIPEKGFALFEYDLSATSAVEIAKEAVGLPIIAQQICQSIWYEIAETIAQDESVTIISQHVERAQQYVADNLYSSHENDYQRLITGPRRRARKHATYEKILASFALEPLVYSLSYSELLERVAKLRVNGEDVIPPASIKAALKAIGSFQKKSKMNLLEWHENDQKLYIIEPSFLFYLRQKLDNFAPGESVNDALLKFFKRLKLPQLDLSKFEKLSETVAKDIGSESFDRRGPETEPKII